ncbi:MAG: hypothetical protein PHU85_15135 [Phycisphaerae bacterium]|nr:hypothetical protein [Phycisphaerae bacterium]
MADQTQEQTQEAPEEQAPEAATIPLKSVTIVSDGNVWNLTNKGLTRLELKCILTEVLAEIQGPIRK